MDPPPNKKIRSSVSSPSVTDVPDNDDEDFLRDPGFWQEMDEQVAVCTQEDAVPSGLQPKQFGTLAHSGGVELARTLEKVVRPVASPRPKPTQLNQIDVAAMMARRQINDSERLSKQLQEREGEIVIIREQKVTLEKELASLRMSLCEAKEAEVKVATEMKKATDKQMFSLRTNITFQDEEIKRLKRELDRKAQELTKERSERSRDRSLRDDSLRTNVSPSESQPKKIRGPNLDNQSFYKREIPTTSPSSFVAPLATTANESASPVVVSRDLKAVCSGSRQRLDRRNEDLLYSFHVSHSAPLVEAAWIVHEDIFSPIDPLAQTFGQLLTQVRPRGGLRINIETLLEMFQSAKIMKENRRSLTHFLNRTLAGMITFCFYVDEADRDRLIEEFVRFSTAAVIGKLLADDFSLFAMLLSLLHSFSVSAQFAKLFQHGDDGFCLMSLIHNGVKKLVSKSGGLSTDISVSLLQISFAIIQWPPEQLDVFLCSCGNNCGIKAIDAIADLLSWLQPSLTIKPAAIQDQIGSSSSLYLMSLERVNLLLTTLQTVLTITGSNNDVYLKVVPLILKEIYADLSKCPDCYTQQVSVNKRMWRQYFGSRGLV